MKIKSAKFTYLKFVSVLQEEKYNKNNNIVPKLIQTDMGTKFQKIRELNLKGKVTEHFRMVTEI